MVLLILSSVTAPTGSNTFIALKIIRKKELKTELLIITLGASVAFRTLNWGSREEVGVEGVVEEEEGGRGGGLAVTEVKGVAGIIEEEGEEEEEEEGILGVEGGWLNEAVSGADWTAPDAAIVGEAADDVTGEGDFSTISILSLPEMESSNLSAGKSILSNPSFLRSNSIP